MHLMVCCLVNIDKCECITKSPVTDAAPLDRFIQLDINYSATLLGAPLSTSSAMDILLQNRLVELGRASDRLRFLPAHDALVLLKASRGVPKLAHIIRSSPCVGHQSLFD